MLPESKNYLKKGGYSPRAASFLLIGLFLVGVFGIRILSQILHKFIPSHVVDCDHTHDEEADKAHLEETLQNGSDIPQTQDYEYPKTPEAGQNEATETTPLVLQTAQRQFPERTVTAPDGSISRSSQANTFATAPNSRRPSSYFSRALSKTFTKYVSSAKDECDENGPCMGFSDPCGQDCFKIVQRRGVEPRSQSYSHFKYKAPAWQRATSDVRVEAPVPEEDHVHESDTNSTLHSPHEVRRPRPRTEVTDPKPGPRSVSATHHYHHPEHEHTQQQRRNSSHRRSSHSHNHAGGKDHHHHVPTNAFMSIGLQTSVAIALHKAPEGFITFATNHANPALGFSVFIALFIHNITEGFALSLPLFLALNSRLKAIIWSSILGGLSQPLGAGIAALWFKLADKSGHLEPNETVYGAIFAITSGVMASVALSLISESLQLSHNRNTCITFAFIGMGLLGISTALTAK